jgi:glutathione S-transferase
MITLYKFGPSVGLPDFSPFVMKAETLLRFAKLPYETDTGGFRRAPKGKLPYIEDDGEVIADSTFIRWHLEKKYGIDFDEGLPQEKRAFAWAVEKMLENHLYWAVVDARWLDDSNFTKGAAGFFRSIPAPLRGLVQNMVRRKVAASLKAQGMGRHTRDEIAALAAKDIEAVAAVLGEQEFLFGATPCAADATAFSFIAGALCPHFDTPIRTTAERYPNLAAYSERMMRRHFPELLQGDET